MFDIGVGVLPEQLQLQQLIASTPTPLSFPPLLTLPCINHAFPTPPPPFDVDNLPIPYNNDSNENNHTSACNSQHDDHLLQYSQSQSLIVHHQPYTKDQSLLIHSSINWTQDELLALFRITSTIHTTPTTTSFPHLTWEYVSRKLAEVGFKRSAEKCREKFEEESSRYLLFTNTSVHPYNNNNNYRFLISDDDHLQLQQQELPYNYNQPVVHPQNPLPHPHHEDGEDKIIITRAHDQGCWEKPKERRRRSKRRKRHNNKEEEEDKKFEKWKGFCEEIVKKMMGQQEEMHNKLLQDILKRDQEKLAIEEAWKKHEIHKLNSELQLMAHQQALAAHRHATLIQFFNNFSTTTGCNNKTLSSSSSSSSWRNNIKNNNDEKLGDIVGRRWPRDEVLALIKLRCAATTTTTTSVNNNISELGDDSYIIIKDDEEGNIIKY